ncbi:MAG: FkbM family methyltransferase [bacterium]
MILWSGFLLLIACFCLSKQTILAVVLYNIITFAFSISLLACVALLYVIRKYKRLQSVLYDFFLFFKSKMLKKTQLSYDKRLIFKHYILYVLRYIRALEFVKTPIYKQAKQDKLLSYKLFFVNYSSMFVMFNEIFGHEVYKFSSDTKTPVIIDAGSNIGLAILYFKACFPDAHIIGFEPGPETFQILQKNVIENKLANVTIHNKALDNKTGQITFYTCKDNAAIGGWSLKSQTSTAYQECPQLIDATPLSPYITQPVDLLKMDIEGAETAVLEELASSGKLKLVKRIILEYHHHMVNVNEDNLSLVLKLFEDNGFGYQFNYVELAVPEKNNRNVLILYIYNKALVTHNL